MGGNIFKQKSLDDVVIEYGDAASFVLVLLGQVYMQTERKLKAVEVLNRALKLNPFLWAAFELLCRLGEKPEAEEVFQLDGLENFSHCHGTNPIASLISSQINQSQDATTKAHPPEPMSVDQISTPIIQVPSGDVNVVNTRYRFSVFSESKWVVNRRILNITFQHSPTVCASYPSQHT